MRRFLCEVKLPHDDVVIFIWSDNKFNALERVKDIIHDAISAKAHTMNARDIQTIKHMCETYKVAQ